MEEIAKMKKEADLQRERVDLLSSAVEKLGPSLQDLLERYKDRDSLYRELMKLWHAKDTDHND